MLYAPTPATSSPSSGRKTGLAARRPWRWHAARSRRSGRSVPPLLGPTSFSGLAARRPGRWHAARNQETLAGTVDRLARTAIDEGDCGLPWVARPSLLEPVTPGLLRSALGGRLLSVFGNDLWAVCSLGMSDSNDPVQKSESLPVPGLPADWHVKATDKIVSTVDQVRVKTSGPAVKASRAAVFGLLGALLALIAGIMFLIGLVRLLNNVIPKDVWLVYLILGGIFMLVGGFLWSRRPRGAAS